MQHLVYDSHTVCPDTIWRTSFASLPVHLSVDETLPVLQVCDLSMLHTGVFTKYGLETFVKRAGQPQIQAIHQEASDVTLVLLIPPYANGAETQGETFSSFNNFLRFKTAIHLFFFSTL